MRIVVTGPESTGKTELSAALANYYGCTWVPEYAREYVSGLERPYTLEDVLNIARVQIAETMQTREGMVIYDTWLVITKVWLDLVFAFRDERIEELIAAKPVNLFLLCEPDLPWYPDPVRENGGEARLLLYERYRQEIIQAGYPCRIISGMGEKRLHSAIEGIEDYLKSIKS
ncbi:MAG: AAA family ATPase [Bacteroidota bacterium]